MTIRSRAIGAPSTAPAWRRGAPGMAREWAVVLAAVALSGCGRGSGGATPAPGSATSLPAGVINSLEREPPPDRPKLVFHDVAQEAGIDFVHAGGASRSRVLPEDMGSGVAWGDYDGDGDPDLYVVDQPPSWGTVGSAEYANRLYRNEGDGTFTDVTSSAGVGDTGFGFGAFWGDYDADGRLDLYVTNLGDSVLYHNDGGGSFSNVTAAAGVANGSWATGAVWFDYDGDGFLDLYVTDYVDFDYDPSTAPAEAQSQYGLAVPFSLNPVAFDAQPNRLYHNQGDGTFVDMADRAGVTNAEGRSLTAAFSDFDLDGRPDLYVGNDVSDNKMFQNLGDGVFRDVSTSTLTQEYRGTMGIAVGDAENDLDTDMYLTHWIAQENALFENRWNKAGRDESKAKVLRFADVADHQGLGAISLSAVGWGTIFADFDLDGRLDLFVVNGSTLEAKERPEDLLPQAPLMLWNGGPTGFYDLAPEVGGPLAGTWVGRGLACADYDADGDVDCAMSVNRGPVLLLRNDTDTDHHWLEVRARGGGSSAGAVGAKLWLTVGGITLYREISLSGSYLSQHAPEVIFGLGNADRVESVEIEWPDGQRDSRQDVPADQLIELGKG